MIPDAGTTPQNKSPLRETITEPADRARRKPRYPEIWEAGGTDAPGIERVEWKPRGQDFALRLSGALLGDSSLPHGSDPIMANEALALAVDVPLPDLYFLRQGTEKSDLGAMSAMH